MVGNRTPRPKNRGPHTVDFSPDGSLLASSDTDGVRLWDPSTGAPVAYLPLGAFGWAARFSPDGSHLLARTESSDPGSRIWPLRAVADGAGRGLQIGPPRSLSSLIKAEYVTTSPGGWDGTGRYLTVNDANHAQAVVLDLSRSAEVVRLDPHPRFNQSPMSPDGRWVATATLNGEDVKVWEVATGRLAWQMPCDSAFVAFSPDGRWLAVAKSPGLECRLWRVGSWQAGAAIQVSTTFFGAMAFARDGRLLAIDDAGRVRLVDPDSGRGVATLDAGTALSAHFSCMAFSPDGTRLVAGRDHVIHLWDLRRIREQLAARGLDWDAPPYPPHAEGRPLASVVLVSSPDHQAQTGAITGAPARLSPPATEPRAP